MLEAYENRRNELRDEQDRFVESAIEVGWRYFVEGKLRRAMWSAVVALDLLQVVPNRYYWGRGLSGDFASEVKHLVADLDIAIQELMWTQFESDVMNPLRSPVDSIVDLKLRIGDSFVGAVMDRLRESPVRPAEVSISQALMGAEMVAVYSGLFPDRERTYVLGEDFEDSPLQEMFEKRERQGRSLQVIIVARDNDTGTGKTTLAVQLCKKWGEDWGAENATNRPGEYRSFLNNKPEGSVLLADEIGQMYDARRSMSEENVQVTQDWQMIRTKRYKTLSTLPGPSFLDKRLKKLADVYILCTSRGSARVYKIKVDDATGDTWREHMCNIEWGPLDGDPDYQEIERMKRDRLKERFENGEEPEEVEGPGDLPDNHRRAVRDDIIRRVVDQGVQQSVIADALDLSPAAISKIANQN